MNFLENVRGFIGLVILFIAFIFFIPVAVLIVLAGFVFTKSDLAAIISFIDNCTEKLKRLQ